MYRKRISFRIKGLCFYSFFAFFLLAQFVYSQTKLRKTFHFLPEAKKTVKPLLAVFNSPNDTIPLAVILDLHMKEKPKAEELNVISFGSNNESKPKPTDPKVSVSEYAIQFANGKRQLLGSGEYPFHLSKQFLFTTDANKRVFRKYILSSTKITLKDSLLYPANAKTVHFQLIPFPGKEPWFCMIDLQEEKNYTILDQNLIWIYSFPASPFRTVSMYFRPDLKLQIFQSSFDGNQLILTDIRTNHTDTVEYRSDCKISNLHSGILSLEKKGYLLHYQCFSKRSTIFHAFNEQHQELWKTELPDYYTNPVILAKDSCLLVSMYSAQYAGYTMLDLNSGKKRYETDISSLFPKPADDHWRISMPGKQFVFPESGCFVALINRYGPVKNVNEDFLLAVLNGSGVQTQTIPVLQDDLLLLPISGNQFAISATGKLLLYQFPK